MKNYLILITTIALTSLAAGAYGIIHDQITYTISTEYFTKFKFYQFGFCDAGNEAILPNARVYVALVGFLATWWTGILVGIGHGLTGLLHRNYKLIANATMVTLAVTALLGIIGFFYGKFYLAKVGVSWWLPDNLIDRVSFITVGSIHNFSYLGGVIGLFVGIAYQIVVIRRRKKAELQ